MKETTPSTRKTQSGDQELEEMQVTGSLLYTEKDIGRIHILAIDAFETLNKSFDSRKISNAVKIRTCNECICCKWIPLQQQTVDSHKKTGKYSQHVPKKTSQENSTHTLA